MKIDIYGAWLYCEGLIVVPPDPDDAAELFETLGIDPSEPIPPARIAVNINRITHFVLRLCDGRQSRDLIINRDLSGGYCKTAVSRWPFSQITTNGTS